MSAVRGLVQEMNTVLDKDKQPEMMDKFNKGIFTLRDMYEQFQVRICGLSSVYGLIFILNA